jgi:hypothetical protein
MAHLQYANLITELYGLRHPISLFVTEYEKLIRFGKDLTLQLADTVCMPDSAIGLDMCQALAIFD